MRSAVAASAVFEYRGSVAASLVASSMTRPYSVHASPSAPDSRSERASSSRALGLLTTFREARSSVIDFSQFLASIALLPAMK